MNKSDIYRGTDCPIPTDKGNYHEGLDALLSLMSDLMSEKSEGFDCINLKLHGGTIMLDKIGKTAGKVWNYLIITSL